MSTIFQFVAGFRRGDAISNSAVLIQRVLRDASYKCEIVCERNRTDPKARGEILPLDEALKRIAPDDIALLHFSIGCSINGVFASLACRKALIYHNVTPAHYFRYINPALADDLTRGREQLAALRDAAEINLAVSNYNAAELRELGFKNVSVLPLPIDIASYECGEIDHGFKRSLEDGAFNILFVGRCVPNKKLEDILTVMHYLQRNVEPRSRFIHVGAQAGCEAYAGMLLARAAALGVRDFRFLNSVQHSRLNACYAAAHAFICLSEHEGFCAPLIEAMIHRVPILARASAAVPETLDGAGVLFQSPPDFPLIAETLGEVLHNLPLRESIIAAQDARLERIRKRDLRKEILNGLALV